MTDKLQWSSAKHMELICSNEVHVWRVCIDSPTIQSESLVEILSADELARAARFRFERDQKRFMAARGILRKILGGYLEEHPQKIRFDYTSYGKPMLATDSAPNALRFNLSHAGAFVLFAVTYGNNIGIDMERIRDDVPIAQIAQRFFSLGENRSLERMDENKRKEVFFQYWTRKEAVLKAMGEGLSFPMEQLDVSLISGRVLSPITLLDGQRENSSWYVQDLFPGRDYAAAIALEQGDCDLSYLDYSE